MANEVKGYFINVNSENVEYGWIYMGIEIGEDSVYVLEGIINDESYDVPKEDLKEISLDEYCELASIIEVTIIEIWNTNKEYDKKTIPSKTLNLIA